MKNKVLKLLMCFTIFNIVISQFNYTSLFAVDNSLSFNYQSETEMAPFKNPKYDYVTKYRRATLGENAAFCIEYGKKLPKASSLAYKGDLSAEALAVLIYGYPNKDLEEFGLSGEEKYEVQYLVTQMAFWEVVTKTGENSKGLAFNIDDAEAMSGYEHIMDQIKSAAKKLADTAMAHPYKPVPRISIDTTNFKLEEKGDLKIAGPYKITGYDGGNTTDFTVKEIKATLSKSAPSNSYVADVNLNAKSEFALGESVYVVSNKSDTQTNFDLEITASGEKLKCASYGSNDSGVQNFATIVGEPVSVVETTNIAWKKDTGNITIVKEDQDGNRIRDVRFEILDNTSAKVAEAVTNANGKIDLINMPTGQYSIREISAPSGYIINSTALNIVVSAGSTTNARFLNEKSKGSLKVVKSDDNGDFISGVTFKILDANKNIIQTITTNSNGIAQSNSLDLGTYYLVETDVPNNIILDATEHKFTINKANQVVTLPLKNDTVKGSLKITKYDEFNNLLSGVKFEVYDQNSKKVDTITTNNSGVAVSKELAQGEYTYVEVSAKDKNLIIDNTPKKFTVTSAGSIFSIKEVNYYKKGNVKIKKVDQNDNPIEGVTFEIYNDDKELIDTIVTDKNGIATGHNDLVLGTYYYKEVSAPDNVEINSEEKSFELKTEGQIVELSLQNNIISGKIKIIKVDEKNNLLEGVTFEILDSNKQVIQTLTTNELGFAVSNQLSKGTYYYREKETLPQYVLDNTEHEIVLKNDMDFVSETVVNKLKSAKLVINKQNKDTGLALQDIRFEILDVNKNIIQSIVTDENGRAESEELTLGTYYYKEVSAPENIAIDNSEYEFKIDESSDNVEKTVYNVQKRLPVTGSFFSTNVIIIIIVSISTILVYIIVKMIIAYIQNKKYGNNN